MAAKTTVLQSYRLEDVSGWIEVSMASVRGWAEMRGVSYVFQGDDIFDLLPDWVREKTGARLVVASDLARLLSMRSLLDAGADRVIWCDADFLIFAPERFSPNSEEGFAFGREVWVDNVAGRPKAWRKIHNAFMIFDRDNPFLDFYIDAALRLLKKVEGPMVPQFIGPKFLTAQHNMIGLPEVPEAGMISPAVAQDILKGGGPALSLMLERQESILYGANLSASFVEAEGKEGLSEAEAERLIEALLASHSEGLKRGD